MPQQALASLRSFFPNRLQQSSSSLFLHGWDKHFHRPSHSRDAPSAHTEA